MEKPVYCNQQTWEIAHFGYERCLSCTKNDQPYLCELLNTKKVIMTAESVENKKA